jgi:ribosome-binding protein aMBF1 (putative translation factor)
VSRKFSDFMHELEEETRREGPEAVAEAEAFRAYFRLAREISARRKVVGLTQRSLAERSGLQQSEISRIEQGNANPTFQTMHQLARALGAELHFVEKGARRAPHKPVAARVMKVGVKRRGR